MAEGTAIDEVDVKMSVVVVVEEKSASTHRFR